MNNTLLCVSHLFNGSMLAISTPVKPTSFSAEELNTFTDDWWNLDTHSEFGELLSLCSKAYAVGKKEKPPFVPQELPVSKDKDPVPKELLCLICKEMLSDAVVIPCCGNSFCDDCEFHLGTHALSNQKCADTEFVSPSGIRTALLDSDQHTCPTCKQSNVSPDTLIANKFLRQVNDHTLWRGKDKMITVQEVVVFVLFFFVVFTPHRP